MFIAIRSVKVTWALCCLWLTLTAVGSRAEVKLPGLISDGMVIQRGMRVAIWGTADPGERVTVTLNNQQVADTANDEGQWRVSMGPLSAGGPFTMTIAGRNTLTLHDVLVGEVWICSGQSNMKMWVGPGDPEPGWNPGSWHSPGAANYQDEVTQADYPMLRLFTVEKSVASKPQRDVKGHWAAARPQSVYDFSAVGYFFGRELLKSLNVPIAMINSSGGSVVVNDQKQPEVVSVESDLSLWLPSTKSYEVSYYDSTGKPLETSRAGGGAVVWGHAPVVATRNRFVRDYVRMIEG